MKLEDIFSPDLYSQINAAVEAFNAKEENKSKQVKLVDLSDGGYVSVDKFNDKTSALSQQITDLNGQIAKRDTDLAELNKKLTDAQNDATKYSEMQTALSDLQTKYANDKTAWEAKMTQQAYEHNNRERAGMVKFTSPAAKRDFIRSAIEKKFQQDGDKLLGYDDFVKTYKTDNPGAIQDKPDPNDDPTIIVPPDQPKNSEKSVFNFKFNGVRSH